MQCKPECDVISQPDVRTTVSVMIVVNLVVLSMIPET
jgi:hypothetical protein